MDEPVLQRYTLPGNYIDRVRRATFEVLWTLKVLETDGGARVSSMVLSLRGQRDYGMCQLQ